MKSRTIKSLFFLTMMFTFSSCIIDFNGDGDLRCERGEGPVVNEVFLLDSFDGIALEIPADVYLTQGSEFEVEVEGYGNLIDILDFRIRDDVLEIDFDDCVRNVDDFRIYITMPEIRYLSIAGSGEIISENVLICDDLDLIISGSGNMNLGIDADDVELGISGSGDVFLEGIADNFELNIPGSGNVRAFRLDASDVDVNISGSGDADIVANVSLRVRISGSGSVRYRGNPDLDIRVSGSGEVINAN